MPRTRRTTARVVPVAEDGTCLLLLEENPARPGGPLWCPVGGAIDPGEPVAEAAVRELHEETGLVVGVDELTGPVGRVVADFTWAGVQYTGEATVFAVALSKASTISFAHLQPEEIDSVLEACWLSPADVAADGRLVWPELPDIMTSAITAVRGQQ